MDPMLIPMMALLIPIIVAPTAIWLGHAKQIRQMEHAERMKALAMGIDPSQAQMGWPAAMACGVVGAGVPIGSFVVTWLATMTAEAPEGIWVAPVLVSFAAIATSKKMFYRSVEPRKPLDSQAWATEKTKPAFDPDAYDVVGSRG